MPLASVATPGAQNCLYNANVRIVRGFDSFTGGQDRLGVLERLENRYVRFGSCNVLHSAKVRGVSGEATARRPNLDPSCSSEGVPNSQLATKIAASILGRDK